MSNRATTAAKGRPKKSYARGKWRKEEDPEAMILWMPDETFCEEMVAVGAAVASRPPHGSRRALLTHRALPSGSGVEAVTRQRM